MRQIISFNPDTVVAGEQFTLTVSHTLEDSQQPIDDLELNLYYNNNQLVFQNNELSSQLANTPTFLGNPREENEDNNDGNNNTNQRIGFLLDFLTPLQPGETELFTVTFNVVEDGDFESTPIVIQGTGEPDFEFVGVNETLTVTQGPTNTPPQVDNEITDFTVDEDAANETIDLSNVFSDPDGDQLRFEIQNNNSELVTTTRDGNNLILDFLDDQSGTAEITVSASDNQATTTDTFTVTVTAVDDAPTVVNPIGDVTVDENADNQTIDLNNVFQDIDSADIELEIVENNQPNDVVEPLLNQEDLTLTLDFRENQSGTENITVRATADGQSVENTFSVTVNPVIDPIEDVIELYRFRNTTTETGTYVYVGEAERDAILADPNVNQTFELEGVNPDGSINLAFTASTQPGENFEPFYRLSSLDNPGTFLFAGQEEYDAIFAEGSDQRDRWERQGFDADGNDIPEFYLYGVGAEQGTPFNRFQNRANNSFLFAGPEETAAINSDPNFSAAFLDQGGAFESIILS